LDIVHGVLTSLVTLFAMFDEYSCSAITTRLLFQLKAVNPYAMLLFGL